MRWKKLKVLFNVSSFKTTKIVAIVSRRHCCTLSKLDFLMQQFTFQSKILVKPAGEHIFLTGLWWLKNI